MEGWRDNISFILVEPREPGNIGAAARALKNLGFAQLGLVRPKRFPADEAAWFAHGAEDVLASTRVHDSLGAALNKATVVIGTTRRPGKKRGLVLPVREAAPRLRALAESNRIGLLFGREDRGLTNAEASACSFMISIPAARENPSFNLAQAVLIVAYELAHADFTLDPPPRALSTAEFDSLFRRVLGLLHSAGYAAKGIRDSEAAIMTDLKRIMGRAGITEREARMLHGVISQVEGGLRKKRMVRKSRDREA